MKSRRAWLVFSALLMFIGAVADIITAIAYADGLPKLMSLTMFTGSTVVLLLGVLIRLMNERRASGRIQTPNTHNSNAHTSIVADKKRIFKMYELGRGRDYSRRLEVI